MTTGRDFWSERIRSVQKEAEAEQEAAIEQERASQQELAAEKSDAEILAELDLPDPETLKAGDDFSAFMGKAVPERIRRKALRKLWGTNATLANLDGLVDYGEDFTDSANVIEGMQTAYQVGKGMLAHVAKQAEEAEIAALLEDEDTYDAAEEDGTEPELALSSNEAVEPVNSEAAPTELPKRRMRFRVEQPQERVGG
ncbi:MULTISPECIES: DUF3306 domain-containing protein [Halocynthiibacter]|uniref:DUF3306 domain-containing protein n=1 Tax=Halocynthiibacter halioticoli TaxID=2986804 RepID=A0AAE3LRX1_9RHOB|nr:MULTISPECIES: DUF3306 domain-containing protein [Halocynthiibacter]MCV6825088.1 DUF3306 domain-containing protein [Halocynthiibacter halioticoli]MCW4058089.1 DUF3306 domain-containing protein [Halocynthiibacter sp. SDUM655004]